MMNIDTHSVVATSKDSVKVGCTTVSRQQARDVIALMDEYKEYVDPEVGDVMLYKDDTESFKVVVTGPAAGVVIENDCVHHYIGHYSKGWTWPDDTGQWTNLGKATKS